MPSSGRKRMSLVSVFQTTARTWAFASLREKYQCPEGAIFRFETSPSTHTSATSTSSTPRMRSLSSLTVRAGRRAWRGSIGARKSRPFCFMRQTILAPGTGRRACGLPSAMIEGEACNGGPSLHEPLSPFPPFLPGQPSLRSRAGGPRLGRPAEGPDGDHAGRPPRGRGAADRRPAIGPRRGRAPDDRAVQLRPVLGRLHNDPGPAMNGDTRPVHAINPGTSGATFRDSWGRLMGVNTAIYGPSGASAAIGFAVPVDTVTRIVPQLIAHGRVIRPRLGIRMDEALGAAVTRRLGVAGVMIRDVEEGSGAAAAGLHSTRLSRGTVVPGEIIQEIDGKAVRTENDLLSRLGAYQAGETVSLTVWWEGRTRKVSVRLQPAL